MSFVQIGYWRQKIDSFTDSSILPFPMPSMVPLDQTDISQRALEILEKYGKKQQYRGHSPCRLCDSTNGSCEYDIGFKNKEYHIPEGYFHYLTKHNVEIYPTLVEIVEYYTEMEICKENPKIYIGYWRSDHNDRYDGFPFPVPSEFSLDQADICKKAKEILKKYGDMTHYDGFSPCRLCDNETNGTSEYKINYNGHRYVIPTGYFHYLTEHNVEMDPQLMAIIRHYVAIDEATERRPTDNNIIRIGHFESDYSSYIEGTTPLNQLPMVKMATYILNKHGTVRSYRGCSTCRFCQKDNGSQEYVIHYQGMTYIIPFGYFHYLTEHNIKIDARLVNIVGYFQYEE